MQLALSSTDDEHGAVLLWEVRMRRPGKGESFVCSLLRRQVESGHVLKTFRPGSVPVSCLQYVETKGVIGFPGSKSGGLTWRQAIRRAPRAPACV